MDETKYAQIRLSTDRTLKLKRFRGIHALGLVLAGLLGACQGTDSPSHLCTPAVQNSCICPNGLQGFQICNSTGQSFGPCRCPTDSGVESYGDGSCDAGQACDAHCDGGGLPDSPANVVDHTLPAVSEGTSASVDVLVGVVVQAPYTVSIASQPQLPGASATASGNIVTYHAPPPGTVSSDGTPDSFTYSITDSSPPPSSATATIHVTVDHSEVHGEGACVDSSTILCKTPDLDISNTGGEFRYISRRAGITHVWTIPPGKRVSYEANIGIRYVTQSSLPVTISLSDDYASDSTAGTCTKIVDREEGALIWYSESLSYRCLLDPQKTYYFRVSGANAGTYWLVW